MLCSLFDDTGLKGIAAVWTRENLVGHLLKNLHRVFANEENIWKVLALCFKVIDATGFVARAIPVDGLAILTYNQRTGIIAPGLFGRGIAFPEVYTDRFGILAYRVGLWKFMDYLLRVIPVWLQYGS